MSNSDRRSLQKVEADVMITVSQFEEEGEAGFRFTRKKSRQKPRPRRSSLWSEAVEKFRAQESLEQEDASRKTEEKPAIVFQGKTEKVNVALYRKEIEETRAFIEKSQEERARWNTCVEEHADYTSATKRHLEAARLEYSQPLSLQEVEARLSESQLQRLTSFSDGSECLAELERMHQELQVVNDRLHLWTDLVGKLSEHANTVVKQSRQHFALSTQAGQSTTAPINLDKLVQSPATPAMRISRRLRKLPVSDSAS